MYNAHTLTQPVRTLRLQCAQAACTTGAGRRVLAHKLGRIGASSPAVSRSCPVVSLRALVRRVAALLPLPPVMIQNCITTQVPATRRVARPSGLDAAFLRRVTGRCYAVLQPWLRCIKTPKVAPPVTIQRIVS